MVRHFLPFDFYYKWNPSKSYYQYTSREYTFCLVFSFSYELDEKIQEIH